MGRLGTFGGSAPKMGKPQIGGAASESDGGSDITLSERARQLAFEGDEGAISFRYVVGSFTRNTATASGTQAVTGVGFRPRLVFFFANESATAEVSIGVDDGTSQQCMENEHGATADTWNQQSAISIHALESGTNQYSGINSSLDVDGFTITWTKTGTPTGTLRVIYVAFR